RKECGADLVRTGCGLEADNHSTPAILSATLLLPGSTLSAGSLGFGRSSSSHLLRAVTRKRFHLSALPRCSPARLLGLTALASSPRTTAVGVTASIRTASTPR